VFTKLKKIVSNGKFGLGPFEVRYRLIRRAPGNRRLDAIKPYKLHLGPGPGWTKPDRPWITVDLDPGRGDLIVDFNCFEGLALDDASALCVYGSHVFEHISIWTSQSVFQEIHRVLQPGGFFRLVLPDVEKSIRHYLAGDAEFELFRRRRERALKHWKLPAYTLFECLREDFLSRSGQTKRLGAGALAHQNAWDYETIAKDLRLAGFSSIEKKALQVTACPEFQFEGHYPSEANEEYRSLYVEAVKA